MNPKLPSENPSSKYDDCHESLLPAILHNLSHQSVITFDLCKTIWSMRVWCDQVSILYLFIFKWNIMKRIRVRIWIFRTSKWFPYVPISNKIPESEGMIFVWEWFHFALLPQNVHFICIYTCIHTCEMETNRLRLVKYHRHSENLLKYNCYCFGNWMPLIYYFIWFANLISCRHIFCE